MISSEEGKASGGVIYEIAKKIRRWNEGRRHSIPATADGEGQAEAALDL